MAQIKVNGVSQALDTPLTVAELIKQQDVAQPDMVSVQVNEEFIERSAYDTLQLKDGDEVDFLFFMGGGQ